MLELDPSNPEELAFALSKAVKQSGLTLGEIAERLDQGYGEKISVSALSHSIWRGMIRLQRALQILAVCGVTEIKVHTHARGAKQFPGPNPSVNDDN